MGFKYAAIGFALCQLLSVTALAGDANYSSKDIVAFFTDPANQTTRGICVGSEEECGAKDADKRRIATFDLLINFDKNSAQLTEDAQNKLLQFSMALRHPALASSRFAVDGFTDATGSDSHNLELSTRRAKSVAAFLNELGIDASRLEASGFGETRMKEPDPYDPRNRRVEAHIVAKAGAAP